MVQQGPVYFSVVRLYFFMHLTLNIIIGWNANSKNIFTHEFTWLQSYVFQMIEDFSLHFISVIFLSF